MCTGYCFLHELWVFWHTPTNRSSLFVVFLYKRMQLIFALFGTVLNRSRRNEEDVDLLRRIVMGEESAMSELYDRYSGLLYTFGMRILRSERDVSDLLQEVFLQTWNKANAYEKGKGTVYTWLVTMT